MPLLHPDDREEARNYWSQHLRGGEAGEHSYRVRSAQGDYRWFLARFEPLRASGGTTLLWLGATLDVEDLKRAEQTLRESEHKLRQIIETVPGLLWVMGREGETTRVNQRVLDYTGKRFEDLLRGGWKGNLHPEDVPETETAFYRAVRTGTSHESLHRIRRADGEYYWHHSRAEPLRDQEGRVAEWYGLSIDIDDRMKAEEALRSSEYNLQKIIETVPGLLWSTGPDGEPTHVNQRMLDYSDMSFEDFKHRGWKAFVHPSDYPEVEKAYYHAIKTGSSYEGSMRLRRSDGAFRWHHARCEPLHNQQGQVVQWYGLSVDIDGRKKAEDLLRRSETKFRDYAETASDWFWEIGPDYKFTVLTENAFGGSRAADRIGTACWDHALNLETEPEKWRLVRGNPDSRKPFRDFVYCALASNGTPMYVRVSGKPMFDADGRFCGYRGTSTDVTALIRAQEEHERLRKLESDLAHMNRLSMMGELAASLAHEIAQPIATARNNVRAALNFSDRSPIDMGEVREALTSVVDDVDRAGAILDRIRDHIKKAPPRKERIDLNKAIH